MSLWRDGSNRCALGPANLTTYLEDIQKEKLLTRYAMAQRSFRHFLPFVKVPVSGVGMVPIEMWPYVEEVVSDLETDRLMARPKSRKIGFTTILSAYALWNGQFIPLAQVLDISKGERDSHIFLGKSKAIYSHLPPELQIPLDPNEPNNRVQMSFINGGKILALPSTADAGRGFDPTICIYDEADFHEFLEESYFAIKPGLDDNLGQLIMTSTVNGDHMGGLFQDICNNAPANNYSEKFYGWKARPGRTQEWYEERKLEYDDLALFEKEHPETREEAFAPAKTLAFFDRDILIEMKGDTKKPVEIFYTENNVQVNIYQKFQAGKRYTAATDTGHGIGQDDSVTVILDVVTGVTAADIKSNAIEPTEFGIASVELLNMYDSPIWAIECNDWGIQVIRIALELKYKHLYYREKDKPGWLTFDTAAHAAPGSRFVMWGDLGRAVRDRLITIFNPEGLAQFLTVIRNPKKGGRIEGQQGSKDDYPMTIGIAWQIRGQARVAGRDRGKIQKDRDFPQTKRISKYVWGASR